MKRAIREVTERGNALKRRQATLEDVARAAGVSISTASRALNNSQLLEDGTRQRVLTAASRVGYSPRLIKRSTERAIFNILLVIPHRRESALELFYDPTEFISSVNHGLGDIRRNIIVSLEDQTDIYFRHKKLGDIDGCLFAYCAPDEKVRTLLDRNHIPWVLVNRVMENANFIAIDNDTSMESVVKTVAGLQRTFRPLFLSHNLVATVSRARKNGFLKAVRDLGLPIGSYDTMSVRSLSEVNSTLVARIRRKDPSIIFCMNDVFAVRLYEAALVSGVKVPTELGIVGFDDSPIRDALSTPIDTVTFNHVDLGFEAAVWLTSVITGHDRNPLHRKIIGQYKPGRTVRANRLGPHASNARPPARL